MQEEGLAEFVRSEEVSGSENGFRYGGTLIDSILTWQTMNDSLKY